MSRYHDSGPLVSPGGGTAFSGPSTNGRYDGGMRGATCSAACAHERISIPSGAHLVPTWTLSIMSSSTAPRPCRGCIPKRPRCTSHAETRCGDVPARYGTAPSHSEYENGQKPSPLPVHCERARLPSVQIPVHTASCCLPAGPGGWYRTSR